jgi:hypothetical protein
MKFMSRWLVFMVMLWMLTSPALAQALPSGVSDARFAKLARGVNLPLWFWFGSEDAEQRDKRITDRELATLKIMGITHVRLPINLNFLLDASRPDLLNPTHLAEFDRALARIFAQDLAVIVDIHSTGDNPGGVFSARLEDDPEFITLFAAFWQSFAQHLAQTVSPEMVFLEPMNEPVFYDHPEKWLPLQAQLISAIHEVAPELTVIATGARWSNLDTLVAQTPLDLPNVIYNFHFYEPHIFTHQGASWAGSMVMPLRDVPYPSSPEAIAPLLRLYNGAEQRGALTQYGSERWNRELIRERMQAAADWAAQHNVRVICNEFGTYSVYAPMQDRILWIQDVRETLESFGFGWTMWEYDDSFGMVIIKSGTGVPTFHPMVVAALGLELP